MALARSLVTFLGALFLAFSNSFAASPIRDALDSVREILTNNAVVSGLSILFIYWGLYALFFWATRFFAKSEGGEHHRVRVALSVVLAFFVGSFFILSLQSAGDKLGYVAGAWLVLLLLIGAFFIGIYKIYTLYFGNDGNLSKAKNWTRIGLFILTLLVFLLVYSLVFAKVSYVVITDGSGSLSVFSSTGGDASVEQMLGDVERRAQSEGGISGGLIGIMASILSSIFSFVFGVGIIAGFVVAGLLISRHLKGDSNENGGVKTSKNNPKGDMREILKHISAKLDDINASFANKLMLLKSMKQLNQNRGKNQSTSSTGVTASGAAPGDSPTGDISKVDVDNGGNK